MTFRILEGNAIDVLATLPDASVQTCVTSPPYWGLRDYGHAGQLGLERTPEEYVARLVAVLREVRRVLADDGTLWLNLGDSYVCAPRGSASSASSTPIDKRGNGRPVVNGRGEPRRTLVDTVGKIDRISAPALKSKDLVGIPWRVAFALQADGWWLRSDIIWHKPNPMPESVTDRPTRAHEYLFLLSKSAGYFYDAEAIAEPAVTNAAKKWTDGGSDKQRGHGRRHSGFNGPYAERLLHDGAPETRNKRDVWTISSKPFAGAHFAVMPEALAEPCILAGSREGDTVLDPFTGSGTVGVVALRHGRSFVGIELNPIYAAMARDRIRDDAPMFNAEAATP